MHTFNDEVHSVWDSNCEIVGKKVEGKFVFPCLGDMRGDYSAYCCGYSNGPKFSVVMFIFVDTEKVGVGEEVSSSQWNVALVDEVEDVLQVRICCCNILIGEVDEVID